VATPLSTVDPSLNLLSFCIEVVKS